jgi:16S rRNA pseudouridine516 synthase
MQSHRQRLDRYLEKQLDSSKKQIKLMLAQKQVQVDGQCCVDGQLLVNQFSRIEVANKLLPHQTPVYIMLNKPAGIVCATVDDEHETVLDLLPTELADIPGLHIAGRLDRFSTGLVLLTNDGRWSRQLSSPDTKVAKHYRVTLQNPITEDYAPAFAEGMYFAYEDLTTQPVKLVQLAEKEVDLQLMEGRYHQIKRMFGRFRNPVISLHRYRIGDYLLPDDLPAGSYRLLD